jgi:hypothetical protein
MNGLGRDQHLNFEAGGPGFGVGFGLRILERKRKEIWYCISENKRLV